MPQILVDADACPVKDEIYKVAWRREVPVTIVSNAHLRVPAHPLTRELLAHTGPLASTSANRHGEPPATTAAEVAQALGAELDAVLDGGPAAGQASTIIDCSVEPPRVLRAGPLGDAELSPFLEASP